MQTPMNTVISNGSCFIRRFLKSFPPFGLVWRHLRSFAALTTISDRRYIVLHPTSPIIKNKYSFYALYMDGVQREHTVIIPCTYHHLNYYSRCVSPAPDLEEDGHSRTHEHTTMIIENFGLQVAWRDYGIAGRCIVSTQ